MIDPVDERLRARNDVMQILIRSEHLAGVELSCIEQIEVHRFD